MEVERYDIDITFLGTVPQLLLDPHPEGEWVKYEDACAALQAQQEKLEEAVNEKIDALDALCQMELSAKNDAVAEAYAHASDLLAQLLRDTKGDEG